MREKILRMRMEVRMNKRKKHFFSLMKRAY